MPIVKRALLSVTNKGGIVEFAKGLTEAGFEVVSTGGTYTTISGKGINCTKVEDVTDFPEILDGRVKTIHPKIFAGIIADQRNTDHMRVLDNLQIKPFGLIVVNLYEFAKDPTVENIDIGGPSMLRAAAKNFNSVAPIVDPNDYEWVLRQIQIRGDLYDHERFMLATKAFRATADYDNMIASECERCLKGGVHLSAGIKHEPTRAVDMARNKKFGIQLREAGEQD